MRLAWFFLALAIATVAAIAVCPVLGVTIERVAYRPLRRAPRLAPLITAIGVSVLLQYSAALIWGKQYISMPELFKPSAYTIGGARVSDLQLFILALAFVTRGPADPAEALANLRAATTVFIVAFACALLSVLLLPPKASEP